MVQCGVYLIRCTFNNKVYVGTSKNIHARWLRHRYNLKHRSNFIPRLQKDYTLHGAKSFEYTVLVTCLTTELPMLERYWIDLLHSNENDTGYNTKGYYGGAHHVTRRP